MQELRDRPISDIQYGIVQLYEDLSSNCLACADRVGLNETKRCLDGTRTEILNEIVDWINSTDTATPRIFWLYGQAGKGKSAIAHTVALHARNLGMLGSFFCFSRVRQNEQLHIKLFPTIARDLADRDIRLRPLLVEVTTEDHSLRDTANVAAQWKKLILEPLSQLKGSPTGNVVVVIDALDESGAEHTRATVLRVLATYGGELSAYIRILLTSRPLVDIGDALDASPHIYSRSLDAVDTELTMRDIHLYVSTRLKSLRDTLSDEDFQQLTAKSGGVFEWARLACDFVSPRIGVVSKVRFHEIMSDAPGDGRTLLDEMYTTFLKDLFRGPDERQVFRSVMRQILWLKEPLPISALDFMRDRFPQEDDRYPVRLILDFMASLLAGANEVSTPVRPLHPSFYDFLLDEERSGEFFIQQGDVHRDLAVASLSVMQAGLRFNICGLETSYISNLEVADLEKRAEENIPPHLLYSCQFWATHLQGAAFDSDLAQLVGRLVTGEQMLFWLEALGISKSIGRAFGALISAERWFHRSMEYEEVLMFIKDGIKFVQNFAGIIHKSTPHLYLSALPFSPSKSMLARSVIGKFGGIATVAVGQQDDWPRNQHVLRGHTSSVLSVAFSPDGRHIVSSSADKTVQLWEAQTGGLVGNPLQGHTDSVLSVAFSPDGRHIVSGSRDKTIQLWDALTGGQVGNPLQGHTDEVFSVAFSPDGRHIVSGSRDKTIQLWDAQTGGQVGNSLQGHTDSILSVAFSPDGRHIVSGSGDKTIRLWDAQTGGLVGNPLQGHTDSVFSVAFSPEGRYFVSGSGDQTIRFWDAQIIGQVGNPLQGHTSSVLSTIRLWDAQTGGQVGNPLQGHIDSVLSVAFSPDGRHILSCSRDQTIQLRNAQTGDQVDNPLQGHSSSVFSVAFSPDGRYIVSGSGDQTIRLWDAHTGVQLGNPLQGHTDSVWSVVFSPDGRHIVSCSEDKTVRLWDVQTGGQMGKPLHETLQPLGTQIDSQVLNPLEGHTSLVNSVAFSPDGRHIVSCSWNNTIQLWDAQTGGLVGNPFQGHTDSVWSVAFSPDGRHIASGSGDKTIRLWDAQTGGQVCNPLQGHTSSVLSVVFSPDGRHIVSGSWDKIIRLWDAQTGGQVGNPLQGHTSSVMSVAFSPDGRHIVSGSWDKTIQLWDAQTGDQVGNPLQGHTSSVFSVAFSPDGRNIASGSGDKTIRLWDAQPSGQMGNALTVQHTKLFSSSPSPICFSSSSAHALHDSKGLVVEMSMQNDGWIMGSNQQLLLWVPPSYHKSFFYTPQTHLVIPRGNIELDLSKMAHGPVWHKCYTSISSNS
ncbi:hypothetical protein SCLCIDRAFT_129798 [Scleroderma citrinum Foug A]|uniref:Nephrocystin 3-like N-terminal domain-containing protein n=1 Tax=Scleroderma citrinum Foug A TaxID=1036808 RepID=A0A0C3DNE8_9AGAM|nr:hypothetical protein SCLCIDRAFT_129798 [Scleroderma citrinum Foug A]